MTNKQVLLQSYPKTNVSVDNFSVQDAQLPDVSSLKSGEVYGKLVYVSVDPYMRARLNEAGPRGYFGPFEINKAPSGGTVLEVLESKNDNYKKGDYVVGTLPWIVHQIVPAEAAKSLNKIPEELKSKASYFIGACGMVGLSAHLPIEHFAQAKAGEVAFVSGAAGAVGSIAGQLLKLKGLRVYGSAGSDEKVDWLVKELGFDGAFNYNTDDLQKKLKEVSPEGVDVFFDNVGGPTLETLLNNMKKKGRIILCGSISNYNKGGWEHSYGVRNTFNIIPNSLSVHGFIVTDWYDQFASGSKALVQLVLEGKLQVRETVLEGIENVPKALVGLFSGENTGKMIVRV